MKNKTAILIFANSAEFEAIQKPFPNATVLFETLNEHTLKVVKGTGIPYFLSSEQNQIGNSFGERFTNAIKSVYTKGFETVITIGNDTPHLRAKHILQAESQLRNNDIVLGPSKDGGFYLMGLKKSYFNSATFLKLPWQTSALHRSISKLVSSKDIKLSYLELLSDIDSVSDINTIHNSFKVLSEAIKIQLDAYISEEKPIFSQLDFSVETIFQQLHFNKGSPLFA